jgi:Arylsulfotransferase (ASST)
VLLSLIDDPARRRRAALLIAAWKRLGRRSAAVLIALGSLAAAASGAAEAAVRVYPIAGSRLATPQTEIAFRGISPAQLGAVSVVGSRSGTHTGQIAGDSDGHGASFVASSRFVAGETVTVKTSLPILGGQGATFSFTIQNPAGLIQPPARRYATPRVPGDSVRYHSRPDLRPPTVRITRSDVHAQDIFLTPMRGPLQWGPMIVDRTGQLVWFLPLSGAKSLSADFRVQSYLGQPVLTWWQGYVNFGVGEGSDVIFNRRYQQIAAVQAGNGLKADLHEFTITNSQTALITSYNLVRWNARSVGGSRDQRVINCTVQEVDIRTARVLFQWDSLDHIPIADTYAKKPRSRNAPLDYFHINSVQRDFDGNLIISARNTWAVYKINYATGAVMWELGGKHSSFKMGPGTSTAFQHHATIHRGGLITIFDDGATPRVHPQSRALLERINPRKHTVTLVRELDHAPKLVAAFEGSVQLLADRHVFVGWGEQPYFTEYDAGGRELFDGRITGANSSYRAYEFAWHSQPSEPPAVAVRGAGHGRTRVYASWNGATDVAFWQVLAGPSPTSLGYVGMARRSGFETAIAVKTQQPYVAVRAVSASRQVLAVSKAVAR